MADRDILVRLKLAATEFKTGVELAFDEVDGQARIAGEKAGNSFSGGLKIGLATLAAAGLTAVAGLAKAVNQSVELATTLNDTSKQLHIGVEALQEYRFAAERLGVASEDIETGISSLSDTIAEAAGGNTKARESFAALDVSVVGLSGNARATESVLIDVVRQLSEIEDPTERAKRGTALLGSEYQRLEPFVMAGADGIKQLTDELRVQNGVLTEKEVAILRDANAEYEQMKNILSVNIAKSVAENADGLNYLARSLGNVAANAIDAAARYGEWLEVVGNEPLFSVRNSNYQDSAFNSPWLGDFGTQAEFLMFAQGRGSRARRANGAPSSLTNEQPGRVVVPSGGSGGGRSRGSGGGGRRAGKSDEQREAERAAQEAIRNEERLRDAIDKTMQSQQDAIYLADLRADKGEAIAEQETARLALIRQYPAAEAETVEQLAANLGIQGELTNEVRERLQIMIEELDVLEAGTVAAVKRTQADRQTKENKAANARLAKQNAEEAERAQRESQEQLRREQEVIYRDLADFYFDVFSANTGNIWKDFKRQGKGVLAELAAQLTLSAISGQPLNFNTALGNVLGQGPFAGGGSPLGTLLGAVTGGFGRGGAANDNGAKSIDAIKNIAGAGGSIGSAGSAAGAFSGLGAAGPIGAAIAVQQGIGSLLGFDSTATAFGGLIGGFIHSLFRKTPAGQSSITSIDGDPRISATKSGVTENLTGISAEFQASLRRIADALGADVGSFGVSIGQRKDYFRVSGNPNYDTGQKNVSGLLYDGKDPEAAIRAALGDALSDGALGGISGASQRILKKYIQDIDRGIEKALMIEDLPKRLQARLDPLGFALDQIDKQFTDLADVLKEGGASAEQITQARQLWELERADAIREIGDASQGLKDYLLSLNAGSNSPLSLRQQEREAEEALKPYLDQIGAAESARAELDRLRAAGADDATIKAAEDAARTAAGQIDQSGFQDAAQLLLGISRSSNASGAGFFEQFDRIRSLTNSAIGSIDNAVPIRGAAVDPFTELTANAAQATANILDSHTGLLQSINNNLAALLAGGGGGGQFTLEDRFFAVAS